MKKEMRYLKRFVSSIIIGLTVLFGSSLFVNIQNTFNSVENLAVVEAHASYNKDILYRRWNAMHGGVYVPITDSTPPNPYLSFILDRDITTENGEKLTLINPAYMTRQVFTLAQNQFGTKGHITSLNPIRKENMADEWETKALQIFEKGATEYSSKEIIDGVEYMRYMKVMKVEASCLKCHARQGYKMGDIRGGISTSVPMDKYNTIAISEIKNSTITYLIIYIIIFTLIIFGYKRIIKQLHINILFQQKIVDNEETLQNIIKDLNQANNALNIAKQNAEESDRLKSAFLANMSHEIRTPMNGILGFSELLKNTQLTGKQQQKYVAIIEKSGVRMLNIINNIISISKIESGIIDLHDSEININNQMKLICNTLCLDAKRKKLTLSCVKYLPQTEAIIKTDVEKFHSILSNLVSNAIKYTDVGKVEFGCNVKINNSINELEFFVMDTGIGIPKSKQETIFERFIQVDIEDNMARQGAGLGLAISKAYVEMLGGKIWVESEEGIGSTFYFNIPIKSNYENPIKEKNKHYQGDITQLNQLKILIVDDDETSTLLLKEIVNKISEKVLTASNGIDAINLYHQNPEINLILMDVLMPEMNGYEATKKIRQFDKDVIIIAQTAFALSGDNEKAVEAGCNDYISKPIKLERLIEIIVKHFKNK